MGTELLAPLDLAFWHLESDAHPMHLGALAVFSPGAGPAPGPEDLLELLGSRAAAIPRLRMRVRDVLLPVGGAAWSVDKDFDVHRHVKRVRLPAAETADESGFMAAATRLAGELMEQPLRRGLPPWQMYVIGGAPDGPFAVLVKLHHALADGMRAVAIGAGIFDEIATAAGRGRPGATAGRVRPVPPRSWMPGPRQVAGLALGRIEDLGRAFGVGASLVRASRLDLRGAPSLSASSSGTRRLATADLDLEAVRRIRRAAGGTGNDVLLAVVAGALRRWMLERGEPLPGADPRALVPVSRRRPGGAAAATGNRLSAYLLGLPVSEPDPWERLRAVRGAMDRNKSAGPLRGAGAVAVLADQLPSLAHRFGAPIAGNAARMLFDVLVTSVPLPRSALSLGGCPLRALYPMAPLARGQSLAVALTTYGSTVQIGLVADGKALPDLDRLGRCAEEEVAELLALLPVSGTP
ncbi:wax ester/triacylglycerol synthase family O-acyltransferase [Streptomyces sp. RTGN2]|uniref:wax ester/triacylglycerol synthase family O-acyltransferase n=1 Tax=unclassified Streptomyces TaxID=2593676 RepID=UPI00255368C7|nr:wax ester/triacylglycerol synthase family O-acyltransferase [Streptomyces sp. RTGN2]